MKLCFFFLLLSEIGCSAGRSKWEALQFLFSFCLNSCVLFLNFLKEQRQTMFCRYCQGGQTEKLLTSQQTYILRGGRWGWSGIRRTTREKLQWLNKNQPSHLSDYVSGNTQKIPQVWGLDLWVVILFWAHQQRWYWIPSQVFCSWLIFFPSHCSCFCCFRASTCQNTASPLNEDTAVKWSGWISPPQRETWGRAD